MAEVGAALLVEESDGLLRLTLDRPEALNALDGPTALALLSALLGAQGRDDVRVVVLTGAGGAFCAGADIGTEDSRSSLDGSSVDGANRLVRAVVALDRPVVAVVPGVAAGVGCSLALAADVAVAAESASFLLAFARVGLMPDGGATATVAAAVGRARAMRMALLAEPLTGREAFDAGLVAYVAADSAVDEVADRVVRRLLAGPPLAQAATKKAVNAATVPHLEAAMEREHRGQSVLLRTADAAEGMRAFAERRRPVFRGD